MKIIGIVDNDHLIIEASKDELANVCGCYSKHDSDLPPLKVGTIVSVHTSYDVVRRMSMAQSELESASKTLHSVANLIHTADPLIKRMVHQDIPEEEVI